MHINVMIFHSSSSNVSVRIWRLARMGALPPALPAIRHSTSIFFFLRLPIGQYGPVSQLSRSEERCTGPFNWGEAHCAGEKVKRKIGPFLRKSLKNQTRTRTQQKGAQPATATRNPLARLPGARANEETNPTNKRLHQQILVRLNVLDLQWTIL